MNLAWGERKQSDELLIDLLSPGSLPVAHTGVKRPSNHVNSFTQRDLVASPTGEAQLSPQRVCRGQPHLGQTTWPSPTGSTVSFSVPQAGG